MPIKFKMANSTPNEEKEKRLHFNVTDSGRLAQLGGEAAQPTRQKYGLGNIDLTDRPIYHNQDGSYSTVDSFSTNIDGREVLLPTIGRDAQGNAVRWTEDEAIQNYLKTGENLGVFKTPQQANIYARWLHNQQADYYGKQADPLMDLAMETVQAKPFQPYDPSSRFSFLDKPKSTVGGSGYSAGTSGLQDELNQLRTERNNLDVSAYASGDPAEAMSVWERQQEINSRIGELEKQLKASGVDTTAGDIKPLDAVHSTFWKGLSGASSLVTSSLDFVNRLGHYALGWTPEEYEAQNTWTSRLNEHEKQNAAYWTERAYKDVGNDNAAKVAVDLGAQVVQAIPNAVTAMVSGGATLAGDASAALTAAANSAGASGIAGFADTLRTLIGNALQNPQFYSSFWDVLGSGYENAKADGASDANAVSYALINGGINALIEIGGGIETPGNGIGQTALEEGLEEVHQGTFERGLQMLYGKRNPVFSLTDENAVINPVTSAKEFTGGALVGGLLGAGQTAFIDIINSGYTNADIDTLAQQATEAAKADGLKQLADQMAAEETARAEAAAAPAEPQPITQKTLRAIAEDPAQLAALGIDTAGKTNSQVREEIRAALVAQQQAEAKAAETAARAQEMRTKPSELGWYGTPNMAPVAEQNWYNQQSADTQTEQQPYTPAETWYGQPSTEPVGNSAWYAQAEQAEREAMQDAADTRAASVSEYADRMVNTGEISETMGDTMQRFYNGSQDSTAYIQGMTAAYNAGAKGTPIDSVNAPGVTYEQKQAAYIAGLEGKPVQSATNPALTRSQRDAAYMAGRAAARQGQTVLAQANIPAAQQTATQPTAQGRQVTVQTQTAQVGQQVTAQTQSVQGQQPTAQQQNPQTVTVQQAQQANAEQTTAQTQKKPAVRAENPGLVQDEKTARAKLTRRESRALDALGKVLGRKIQFVETLAADIVDEDGNVRRSGANAEIEGDTIRIALDSDDPFLTAAVHEVVHGIRDLDEASYQALAKFVANNMSDDYRKVAEWEEARKGYNQEQIPEEIVCDAFGRMLGDEALLQQFVQDDRTAAQKFFDALHDLLVKVQRVLSGGGQKLTDNQRAVYSDLEARIETMLSLFGEALENVRDSAGAPVQSVSGVVYDTPAPAYNGSDTAVIDADSGKRYSMKSAREDFAGFNWDTFRQGRMYQDLRTLNMSDRDIHALFNGIQDLVEYMAPNRGILDMNEETGRGDRKYKPFKPNSDPLYKVSLDFSTLCRKRLMTQFIIEQLQLRENRSLSAEEQLTIRNMLIDYRAQDKALQVACAMCYVESARLKSPKFINAYLENPEPVIVDYLAKKNKSFAASVRERQAAFKEERGYARSAAKKDMSAADVKELNSLTPQWRQEYTPSAEERAIIDYAKTLPNSTYLTAENLARLASGTSADQTIYDAYTNYIREMTHSKGLETGVAYYYGDSKKVSANRLAGFNAENGLRFDSWSDFQFEHMLDMMTAVIDLSTRKVGNTRGAKMHGYTKFPEMVRIFGKTGMMFNLSGVSEGDGFNEDGSLRFSKSESVDYDEAVKARDQFPETAGLQCIGINDRHIRALLASAMIDYIIPYHRSGMNAMLRRMAGIDGWTDYEGTQEASIDKDVRFDPEKHDAKTWHKEPVFSEFFVGYGTGMSGIDAMRASAENYKRMCAERGMKPKFEAFSDDPSYWKLLIDRKMINQKTGALIEQKPVRPVFDFDAIKKEVDRYVANYDPELQNRALDYITKHWQAEPTEQASVLGNEMFATQQRKRYSLKEGADNAAQDLAESQRKNYDYNQKQTETGSVLRTLGKPGKNGSSIKRSKYGVGKEIGGTVYFHRDYVDDVIPSDVYEAALQALQENYPDFQFNCVEYNPKDNTVRFDEAPGFDTEREPTVGDYVRVKADGTTEKGHTDYIWHHKWLWVKDDYTGFNVRDAWEWSKKWLSTISGKTYDVNGKPYNDNAVSDGNGISRWNAQLDAYGLPRDGAASKARGKRYSLKTVPPVQPSSDAWQRGHDEAWFVQNGYPIYRDVAADQLAANEETGQDKRGGKHGSQITSTISTYQQVYDTIKAEHPDDWQDLRILDASSGIGLGTRIGREMGFNVTDIEPYPSKTGYQFDKKRDNAETWTVKHPDYEDYSKLEDLVADGKVEGYDYIISNAVLNVIPQDTRDELVVAMGHLLNPGGQMFVNVISRNYQGAIDSLPEVRKNDKGVPVGAVRTAEGDYSESGNIKGRGHETFVWKTNTVQKVFSYNELIAYLRDALGDGYTVEPFTKYGMTAAIVTKDANHKYSRSGRDVLDEYVEQYGEIKRGEKPARDFSMPKRTAPKTKVSMTARTVTEAGATPESFVPTIENLAANHEFSYTPYSDEAAISNAAQIAKKKGWSKTLTDWSNEVSNGGVSKTNTAVGWALYNNAVNSGDTETALNVLNLIVKHQRNAAQAVQATRILKQLNPETQLYSAEQTVVDVNEDLKKRLGKDAPEVEIDPDLAEQFLRAKNQDDRDKIMTKIFRDIGRQMPTTFLDRWTAWRYTAMLGNARTIGRNIAGNAGFAPVVWTKDAIATAIEAAASAATGGKIERTKGNVIGRGDLLEAAWKDYDSIQAEAMGEGKYSDRQAANKEIQDARKIFGNTRSKTWNKTGGRVLEGWRVLTGKAMDVTDVWFNKPQYVLAMAQYCAANGITAEQIRSGKGLDSARAYAIREAQKATYRDTNDFSQMVSSLGKSWLKSENAWKRGIATLGEGVLPFRKTPANILARGIEYSPIWLLKAISYDAVQVAKGNMSAADMIDNLSAGLTGTGLLAFGVYLAAQGLLRGRGRGDDKKKEFADLEGHQDYALELPDGTSITLDWLAPEALPVFIGANLWEAAADRKDGMKMKDILTAVSNVSEPMLQMSMLQSLNDLLDGNTYGNEETSALMRKLSSAATSYLTQAFPTLLGQVERTNENKRMTTYTDKNGFLTSDMQYILGKISAKIPGWDFQQIPYIDAWGREELTGKFLERAGQNFVNPSFVSKVNESEMEKELERLYDSTGESVFPQRAAKYFNVDGERKDLSAKEYVTYATEKGRTSYTVVGGMVESDLYKNMSDAEKAACIEDAYSYANQTARTAVGGKISDSWVEKAQTGVSKGIKPETFILARNSVSDVNGVKDKNGNTISNSAGLKKMQIIYSIPGLTYDQRKYLFECFGVGKTIIDYNKALVDQKLAEMQKK